MMQDIERSLTMRTKTTYNLAGLLVVLIFILSSLCAYSALIEDSQPTWSPDGKRVAFVSNRALPENAPDGTVNIWVVDADGNNLLQITFQGTNKYPSWSPDGKKIIFQNENSVWQVEVDSKQFTHLAGGDKRWYAPDWHPKDPSKVVCAFQTHVSDDNDLAIINPMTVLTRSSGTKTVRERVGSDDLPRWSKDGKRIAFIGKTTDGVTRDSNAYLMTMSPEGMTLKTHCKLTNISGRPSWFVSGESILLDGGVVCDLATGKTSSLFEETIKDPDVSPDGRWVAYCQKVEDSGQFIFTRKINGEDKKQITNSD